MPEAPLEVERIPIAAVIVLAAGAGTRMKSSLPKVLHPMSGHPMLWHAVKAAAGLDPRRLVTVIGHQREQVGHYLDTELPGVTTAIQDAQLGTGHAVACALEATGDLDGIVIVTYGDVPLLTTATLTALATEHVEAGNAVTVLTAVVEDPTGYGRILRSDQGSVVGIVEQKEATPAELAITEINSGVYAFDAAVLTDALGKLTTQKSNGERYLTEVLGIAHAQGKTVGAVVADDAVETEGVNDRVQLAELSRRMNARLVRRAQLAGVTVLDPQTTWVHADVTIGRDTVIAPNTHLEAGTVIGENCVIGPDTTLIACEVGDGAQVLRSQCQRAVIGPRASVGPFSYLRPGAVLAEGSKVGAYVEVKNSTIGEGSKVPHLSYVGDTEIGAGVNFGAGSITANYDGESKARTTIGDRAFIGTNTTLIAPVTVGAGAFVAAGSTITDDVEPGDLGIARGRQGQVRGWVLRRRPTSAASAAAVAAGARPADDFDADSASAEGSPVPDSGSASTVSGEDNPT